MKEKERWNEIRMTREMSLSWKHLARQGRAGQGDIEAKR